MIADNTRVIHKSFGSGVVTVKDSRYFYVVFGDGVRKTFVYPDAFERFLTLEDGSVSEEIVADIAASAEAKKKLVEKKEQENLHSMMHGIVIPGKETAAEGEEDENNDKNNDTEEV